MKKPLEGSAENHWTLETKPMSKHIVSFYPLICGPRLLHLHLLCRILPATVRPATIGPILVYASLTERQRIAQLVFPKVVPTQGDASKATIRRLIQREGCGDLLLQKVPAKHNHECLRPNRCQRTGPQYPDSEIGHFDTYTRVARGFRKIGARYDIKLSIRFTIRSRNGS